VNLSDSTAKGSCATNDDSR